MTWCDKLASTPGVGFQFDPLYVSGDAILNALHRHLDTWGSADKPPFSVPSMEAFKVDIQHDNGFLYQFDALRASITFQHRMKLAHTSGGLPRAELISSPQPYSKLLTEAEQKLIDMTLDLPGANTRVVRRIGIISQTHVAFDDLPPGIAKFINYMSRPWSDDVYGYSIQITGSTKTNDKFKERCIHTVVKPEDDGELLNISFDWQRKLIKPIPVDRDILVKEMASAEKSALEYFEDLAIGNLFDERIYPR